MSGDTTVTKTHGNKAVADINKMIMDAQYFGKSWRKKQSTNRNLVSI